jgi:Ca2+/Na+ antiporter
MYNLIEFLAKMIGVTGRVGLAVALTVSLIAILRGRNVEALTSIDESTYGIIVAVGIFGACLVAVDFMIALWNAVKYAFVHFVIPHWADKKERRQNRETALKNLKTTDEDIIITLRYLKARKRKRFLAPAPGFDYSLRRLVQFRLIEIDDPNYPPGAREIHYSVPDYVWDEIEPVAPEDLSSAKGIVPSSLIDNDLQDYL